MEIGYLSDHPALVPELARTHVQTFGALLPDWTVQGCIDELATHRQRRAIPTTLVALDGGDWLGSVSLLENDHEHIRQYSPWLATLVVRPQARGKGVGRQLVARCVAEAAALGVRTLYLYCTDAVEYYRALGWRVHDHLPLGPLQVTVMAMDPEHAPSNYPDPESLP